MRQMFKHKDGRECGRNQEGMSWIITKLAPNAVSHADSMVNGPCQMRHWVGEDGEKFISLQERGVHERSGPVGEITAVDHPKSPMDIVQGHTHALRGNCSPACPLWEDEDQYKHANRGDFGMPPVGRRIEDAPIAPEWGMRPDHVFSVHGGLEEIGNVFLKRFPQTELAKRIMKYHAPAALDHFIERNGEYGDDDDFNLGSRGQYVDISRKVQKLKRRMWDGQPEPDGAESTRTVVMELIGHLLMTMDYLDSEAGDEGQG